MKTQLTLIAALFFNFLSADVAASSRVLTFFTVENIRCDVKIQWGADTSMGITEYVVEKSQDGRRFFELTVIRNRAVENAPGSGTIRRFEYMDRQPYVVNFYRIRVKDRNGDVSYSRVIKLKSPCWPDNDEVSISPNPVNSEKGFVGLQMEWPSSNCTIQILDLTGRTVREATLTGLDGSEKAELDVAGLREGLYLVSVKNRAAYRPAKLMISNR